MVLTGQTQVSLAKLLLVAVAAVKTIPLLTLVVQVAGVLTAVVVALVHLVKVILGVPQVMGMVAQVVVERARRVLQLLILAVINPAARA